MGVDELYTVVFQLIMILVLCWLVLALQDRMLPKHSGMPTHQDRNHANNSRL